HFIIVVIFCFAVGMLNEAYRQRLAREEVEYERNKAELALYKAQINPHFLFNTLNTLYGLLITHSDKTEAMLERFINMTKYMYTNANLEYISLAEEVEYIGQYIDLQKLRLNEYADVRFTSQVDDENMPLPPMMLITFVENAFKYGVSSIEPCFIHIRLTQQNDTLCFEVENSVFECNTRDTKRTGIANCRRRLSLLYPGSHSLDLGFSPDKKRYSVKLQIKNDKA
ncbi:MAG: sensor histidine kinase, partial [Muribaculaceae bacterium]